MSNQQSPLPILVAILLTFVIGRAGAYYYSLKKDKETGDHSDVQPDLHCSF